MENFTTLPEFNGECDGCPVHGGDARRTYEFGQYADATVTTFWGCGCAVCTNEASYRCGVPLGGENTYHDCYPQAAGRARLIVAGENADNAALS